MRSPVALWLMLGCVDPEQPRPTIEPPPPEVIPPPKCELQIDPSFTPFQLGDVHELTIRAAGSTECEVRSIRTDFNLFELDAPPVPFLLSAGAAQTISVRDIGWTDLPGSENRTLTVYASDMTTAEAVLGSHPALSDCLSISPRNLTVPFGLVPRNESASASVEITNGCSVPALMEAEIAGGPFALDDLTSPIVVPADGSFSLGVTYTAATPLDIGRLELRTNDFTKREVELGLRGEAAVPLAEIFPARLDLGSGVVRDPPCFGSGGTVEIFNDGNNRMVISRLELAGDDAGAFSIDDVALPAIVPQGEGLKLRVRFHPVRMDPPAHAAHLEIAHDADGSPGRVDLIGTAIGDGPVTDVFVQPEGPEVDVLFAIDDSASMSEEHDRLVLAIPGFVAFADQRSARYQIGATTAHEEGTTAGALRQCSGAPPIVTESYGTPATRGMVLQCLVDPGTTGGSSDSSGLGAAKRAIARALDPPKSIDPNAGFLRRDARLTIVAVSNKDDGSNHADDLLFDYLASIKGEHRPDLLRVYAIAGPLDSSCGTAAIPGQRYRQMVDRTGGTFLDICQNDWTPLVEQIGASMFEPLDRWTLTVRADPETLEVRVNDVAIAPGDFEFDGRSIRLASPPSPGDTVTAGYSPLCLP
jgi:hypothetical protein